MPTIDILQFGGRVPRINPKRLAEHQSQTATNCDTRTGSLEALKGITQVSNEGLVTPTSFWKLGSAFKVFGNGLEVDAVNSAIQETNNRFAFTGDSFPKQSDSSIWPSIWRLGVQPPETAPVITINGTGDGETQDVISYVYTFVTSWGEESAPSPATAVTTIEGNQTVQLTGLNTRAGTNNDVTKKRIYRISSGSMGAEYQYLAEINEADTTYDDDNGANALNTVTTEVLATEYWECPPDDLKYLTQAHAGMLVGASGKELCISEPYIPYAWDSRQRLTFDSNITGIGVWKETILVITEKFPYIVYGSSPESLYSKKINISQPCVAHKGIVPFPGGILYPSPDGLCLFDGNIVSVLSKGWIKKEQWQAMTPANLKAGWHESKYWGIFKGTNVGIMVDTETGEYFDFNTPAPAEALYDIYIDEDTDTITLLTRDSGGTSYVHTFNTGSALTYTWKSKEFVDKDKYTCAKVTGAFTSITFKFYLDGILVQTKTVTSEKMFRLPAKGYHISKEVQVEGTEQIDSIQLATSPKELV